LEACEAKFDNGLSLEAKRQHLIGLTTQWIAVTFMVVTLFSAPVRADDWEECHNVFPAKGDEAISACSRLITAGNLNGYDLVGAYIGRGLARKDKGDLDGAIADYSQAIKVDPKDGFSSAQRGSERKRRSRRSYCRLQSKHCSQSKNFPFHFTLWV
jgi:tetratricopeptide (TPR) repeat protein